MSPTPGPVDPISALAVGAAQAHELYETYVKAGFAENQALYLLGQLLAAAVRGPAS